MVVELAFDHLTRRSDDSLADLAIKAAQRHVHFGSGELDDAERPDHRLRLLFPADLEIAQRPLRLRPPIAVGSDLDGAKGIGFGAGLGHRVLLCELRARSSTAAERLLDRRPQSQRRRS